MGALTWLLIALRLAPSPTSLPITKFRARIVLVTLGYFPVELIPTIERDLRSELEVDVIPGGEAWPSLDETWDDRRRAFAGEPLDDFLAAELRRHPRATAILGLMDMPLVELSPDHARSGANGEVGGLAAPSGHAAVITIVHWAPGDRLNPRALERQASTLAIHEVGHLLGLDDTELTDCAMDLEASSWNLPPHLCPRCRARLAEAAPFTVL